MAGLAEAVIAALEPYVGRMVADTCVRATALSMGKMTDDLDAEDVSAIQDNVRRLLTPVAPGAVIDSVIVSIQGAAA